jgi:hypothetical protein
MITSLALMSIHRAPVVPLAEICEPYFGLSYPEAIRRVARGEFPVPAFRLRQSHKAPLVVSCVALGEYIDRQHEEARELWARSQI